MQIAPMLQIPALQPILRKTKVGVKCQTDTSLLIKEATIAHHATFICPAHSHYICTFYRHFSGEHWGRRSRTQRCHSSSHPTPRRQHHSPFQWQIGSPIPDSDPPILASHLTTRWPPSPFWSSWLPVPLQQVQLGVPHSGEAPAALAVPCHEGGDRVPPLF